MTERSSPQEDRVAAQFGAVAADYVTSPAHATGEDLAQLTALAEQHPSGRALDLGCGGGHASFAIAPHCRTVTAFDLSRAMLDAVTGEAARRALPNIETSQGSVAALPFADARFDLVVSRYSAHHWADLAAALREARRVLAPGGHALFIDVVAPEEALLDTHLQAWELLRDPSHVRNHAVSQWRRTLAEARFVPGALTMRRLHLDYQPWIARMRTREAESAAIRRLQDGAPDDVREHFAIETDGSFTVDVIAIAAEGDAGA